MAELEELAVTRSTRELSAGAQLFLTDGQSRFRSVYSFDFVPSNYLSAWQLLDSLPRGRFCEWGSGFGIATGIAEMLGFEASGIELDAGLADASRKLLDDHGLRAPIITGSYFEVEQQADVYYVYCWPSLMDRTEQRFLETAPLGARLVICHGQDDLRCKQRMLQK